MDCSRAEFLPNYEVIRTLLILRIGEVIKFNKSGTTSRKGNNEGYLFPGMSAFRVRNRGDLLNPMNVREFGHDSIRLDVSKSFRVCLCRVP